jgi:hypothetical protein
MMKSH